MAVELRLDNIKWPKDFPELKALDDLLRCGICYGYIKTCMITSCSHNYCSLCIRKSMQYKTQCPICFEETYEPNLRNNRSFDQFVDLFSGIRDKLLRHLRIADLQLGQPQQIDDNLPRCFKFEQYSPVVTNSDVIKKIKGENSRLKHVSSAVSSQRTEINKPSVSRRLESELISPPSRDDGLPTIPKMFLSPKKQADTVKPKQSTDIPTVPCPVCGVDIPERNINIHLDNCLERSEKPIAKSPEKRKKRSPLAKMVHSMMSDKDLRKKLKEHGLNSQGDKKVLINRLQRFTVLYNSECDSDNPRPIADIIRQMEKEENGEKKGLGSLLAQPRLPAINRKTDPKIIEEENKKYIQENKDSFHALINAVRMRERRCPPKPARRITIESDEELNDESNKEHIENDQSAKVDEDRTLFDSSDEELSEEYPSSPVLRSSKTPLRTNSFMPKESLSGKKGVGSANCTPQSNKGKEKTKLLWKRQGGSKTVNGFTETQVLSCDSDSSAPSPSCIIPEDEDDDEDDEDEGKEKTQITKPLRKTQGGSKTVNGVIETQVLSCDSDSDSSAPSPSCIIPEDEDDDEDFERKEKTQITKPLRKTQGRSKTVNGVIETQVLSCDSDSSAPSPSCIIPEDEDDDEDDEGKEKTQITKPLRKTQGGSKTVNGVIETQVLSCDSNSSAPSPSCIVPEDEDDISSLSSDSDAKDNAEAEELGEATERYLEVNLKDSQIDDPDFSLNDEDLEHESEEIFLPSRRSKRKLPSLSPSNKCQTPVSQSKRKIKTPTSSGPESPVGRTLRKRAKR